MPIINGLSTLLVIRMSQFVLSNNSIAFSKSEYNRTSYLICVAMGSGLLVAVYETNSDLWFEPQVIRVPEWWDCMCSKVELDKKISEVSPCKCMGKDGYGGISKLFLEK